MERDASVVALSVAGGSETSMVVVVKVVLIGTGSLRRTVLAYTDAVVH